MDVTCDRCSTEYEFEAALVSPRGTTVKCTQCGHLFKVYRPEAPLTSQTLGTSWTVRKVDGSTHQVPSLGDLTRLIGEGAFTRDDEVSRTGRAFKRLGDIEELERFFAEADRRGPSRIRRATQGIVLGLSVPKPSSETEAGPSLANGARDALANAAVAASPASPTPAIAAAASPTPTSTTSGNPTTLGAAARTAAASGRPSDHSERRPNSNRTRARSEPPPALSPAQRASDDDDIATEQRPLPYRAGSLAQAASTGISESQRPRPLNPASSGAHANGPATSVAPMGPQLMAASETQIPSSPPPAPALRQPAPSPGPLSDRELAATTPMPLPRFYDDDASFEPKPRSALWLWLFAAGASALAVAIWQVWPMPAPPPTNTTAALPSDPSGQFLARADAAFATHRSEHFEAAITDYIKALAFHENDAHALSSLSRVYAVWAQELLFQQRSAEPADKAGDSSTPARADQQLKLAEQAKFYAESAARKNPGNAEAEVALSDALRLTGNLVAARSELDRARAADHNPSAETLRVAALLAIDEADGNARAGLPFASRAVAQDPDLLRTQLLLARCLVADGDVQGARYHLRAVTTRDREHPSAAAIERLIERADEPAETARDSATERANKTDAAMPAQFENLSHEGYISRGQSLLEAGQVTAAKRMFEQALYIRPSSTQAHAGLGFVALEKGRPQLAAEHFVAAARGGNEDALIGLGDAYRRLQRPKDALRAYQNYLAQKPNGRQVTIARAQVERLGEELAQAKKER